MPSKCESISRMAAPRMPKSIESFAPVTVKGATHGVSYAFMKPMQLPGRSIMRKPPPIFFPPAFFPPMDVLRDMSTEPS
eukprot:1751182-Prymnesium_polylepis.1